MSTVTTRHVATAELESCPSWCEVDHRGDWVGDLFHRGASAVLSVPEGSEFASETDGPPRLDVHLVLPEFDEMPGEPAQITVNPGGMSGPYAEMNLEQTDQFIRQGKAFLARVEQMRNQLAQTIKEQQS